MNVPFYVLGMQRSGTTFIANHILERFGYFYCHEPMNPRFGLTVSSKCAFIDSLDKEVSWRSLKWDSGSLYFSRPSLVSKLADAFGQPIFVKCPFFLFYCEKQLRAPVIFTYRGFNEFAMSNLKRGFTFRGFLAEAPELDIKLRSALEESSDVVVVAHIYIFLARRALSQANIFPVRFDDKVVPKICYWAELNAVEKRKADGTLVGIIKALNIWGKGMMRAKPDYDESRRVQNHSDSSYLNELCCGLSEREEKILNEANRMESLLDNASAEYMMKGDE